MATKSQSLELTIRNAKGVKGETNVISCGAGLELWVTINQSGQTAKKWNLRYTDAAGKRQKARIGSYPELTLAKARAEAEDLKASAKPTPPGVTRCWALWMRPTAPRPCRPLRSPMRSNLSPELESCPKCGRFLVSAAICGQWVLLCRGCGEIVK